MKFEDVKKKWAATEKLLEIKEHCDSAQNSCLVCTKLKLQIAVMYLRTLDEHDVDYKMPFTRDEFLWAIRKPAGKDKLKRASEWCHQCYLLQDKVHLTWN